MPIYPIKSSQLPKQILSLEPKIQEKALIETLTSDKVIKEVNSREFTNKVLGIRGEKLAIFDSATKQNAKKENDIQLDFHQCILKLELVWKRISVSSDISKETLHTHILDTLPSKPEWQWNLLGRPILSFTDSPPLSSSYIHKKASKKRVSKKVDHLKPLIDKNSQVKSEKKSPSKTSPYNVYYISNCFGLSAGECIKLAQYATVLNEKPAEIISSPFTSEPPPAPPPSPADRYEGGTSRFPRLAPSPKISSSLEHSEAPSPKNRYEGLTSRLPRLVPSPKASPLLEHAEPPSSTNRYEGLASRLPRLVPSPKASPLLEHVEPPSYRINSHLSQPPKLLASQAASPFSPSPESETSRAASPLSPPPEPVKFRTETSRTQLPELVASHTTSLPTQEPPVYKKSSLMHPELMTPYRLKYSFEQLNRLSSSKKGKKAFSQSYYETKLTNESSQMKKFMHRKKKGCQMSHKL